MPNEHGPSAEDDALVARIRRGDHSAFAQLFRAYYTSLVNFCARYTHDQETAEDIVGGIFSSLWESHASWSPSKGIAPFLYASVRNRGLNVIRDRAASRQRVARYEPIEVSGLFGAELGEESAYSADDIRSLKEALSGLPEEQRTIMHLRWNRRLPWNDIAAIIGISVDAASKRHERTLALLRDRLRGVK